LAVSVLRQLQFAVAAWREDGRTDAELLDRFTQDRDEQAFGTLVGRHGGLVWGVCVRRLGNTPDAEDAFQATFLRLAKDARSLRQGRLLPNWLYRAARCCVADVRRGAERQGRIRDRLAAVVAARREAERSSDLGAYLEEELTRLPAGDRALLLMCVVEGRTYAEVSRELGCSVAAVHRRLVRAQDALRDRLAQRSPAVMIAAAGLGAWVATAPARVQADTLESCLECATRGAYPATKAGTLAAGLALNGSTHRVLVGALLVGLTATGFTVIAARPGSAPVPLEPIRGDELRPTPEPEGTGPALVGTVCDPAGKPIPGARVLLLVRDPYAPGARGLRDAVAGMAGVDAQGRFRVTVPDFPTWFPEQAVVLQASAPGRAPATVPVRGRGPSTIALSLAAGRPLTGRVADDQGRPVSRAVVRVVRIADAVFETALGGGHTPLPGWPDPVATTADGSFTFPGLAACENVWVRAEAPGFVAEPVRVDGRTNPVVELEAGADVELRVQTADGRPVPWSRVTVVTDRPRSHAFFTDPGHGLTITKRAATGEVDAVTDADGLLRTTVPIGQMTELLIHPPAGDEPFVGIRLRIEPKDHSPRREVVRLPRGEWVTGTVRDADTGRPLADAVVHWGREDGTLPEWRDDLLVGRDALVRCDAAGRFRVAVAPGACTVRVYGGSLDFRSVPVRLPASETVLFAHANTRLDVVAGEAPAPLDVRLRRGTTVTGRAADGAFVLCSGRVSPVRGYSALPLPVRDGRYELPGCTPGSVTRAYFLDTARRVGAVVDVACETTKPGPDVRLDPCGSVAVQVSDRAGQPVAGLPIGLSLLIDRGPGQAGDAHPVEWFDPVNYPTRPVTGADGTATLPALIPGARYVLTTGSGTAKVRLGEVRVGPGEATKLAAVFESGKDTGERQ
jgi:RNA polymerase sigma factor (sigma-70 family)